MTSPRLLAASKSTRTEAEVRAARRSEVTCRSTHHLTCMQSRLREAYRSAPTQETAELLEDIDRELRDRSSGVAIKESAR